MDVDETALVSAGLEHARKVMTRIANGWMAAAAQTETLHARERGRGFRLLPWCRALLPELRAAAGLVAVRNIGGSINGTTATYAIEHIDAAMVAVLLYEEEGMRDRAVWLANWVAETMETWLEDQPFEVASDELVFRELLADVEVWLRDERAMDHLRRLLHHYEAKPLPSSTSQLPEFEIVVSWFGKLYPKSVSTGVAARDHASRVSAKLLFLERPSHETRGALGHPSRTQKQLIWSPLCGGWEGLELALVLRADSPIELQYRGQWRALVSRILAFPSEAAADYLPGMFDAVVEQSSMGLLAVRDLSAAGKQALAAVEVAGVEMRLRHFASAHPAERKPWGAEVVVPGLVEALGDAFLAKGAGNEAIEQYRKAEALYASAADQKSVIVRPTSSVGFRRVMRELFAFDDDSIETGGAEVRLLLKRALAEDGFPGVFAGD